MVQHLTYLGWWLLGFSMVLPSYFDIEVSSSKVGPLVI